MILGGVRRPVRRTRKTRKTVRTVRAQRRQPVYVTVVGGAKRRPQRRRTTKNCVPANKLVNIQDLVNQYQLVPISHISDVVPIAPIAPPPPPPPPINPLLLNAVEERDARDLQSQSAIIKNQINDQILSSTSHLDPFQLELLKATEARRKKIGLGYNQILRRRRRGPVYI